MGTKRLLRSQSLLLLLCAVTVCGSASAQTVAATSGAATPTFPLQRQGDIGRCVHLDCLSNASGAVVATLTGFWGTIQRVVINPDASGTQPSSAFDLVLTDIDGEDTLRGLGADLSNSANTVAAPYIGDATYSVPVAVAGDLTFTASNVGNAKGFTFTLYLEH